MNIFSIHIFFTKSPKSSYKHRSGSCYSLYLDLRKAGGGQPVTSRPNQAVSERPCADGRAGQHANEQPDQAAGCFAGMDQRAGGEIGSPLGQACGAELPAGG